MSVALTPGWAGLSPNPRSGCNNVASGVARGFAYDLILELGARVILAAGELTMSAAFTPGWAGLFPNPRSGCNNVASGVSPWIRVRPNLGTSSPRSWRNESSSGPDRDEKSRTHAPGRASQIR